jgi:[ribosomal protein S18]-alanine N-acetyltransferase
MIKIPTFARIGWNTFDDKIVERDDQESIFLATFDDIAENITHRHQIDYSYYNRGRHEAAPKFVLHVYSYGKDYENYSDTINHFDKEYDTMDSAADDINHWLQFFQEKVSNFKTQKIKMEKSKKSKKSSKSTLSLNLVFRKDTFSYVTDFFTKGIKSEQLPSVLYGYDFNFKNKPNFSGNTTMFCEKKKGRYYLSIFHKFDFKTEVAEAYWFVGGLAQYAEDNPMAGYVTQPDGNTQIFGFKDNLCFWENDLKINFNSAIHRKTGLNVREIKPDEIPFLEEMLYQAIFTPKGSPKPDKSIIFEPFLHHYIKDFGQKHDVCLVAEHDNKLIGAVWTRIFSSKQKGYAYVDKNTPELSIAVDFPYRNSGVGSLLLFDISMKLLNMGYKQVAVSVDYRNPARQFYLTRAFKDVKIEGNAVLMVSKL